MSAIVLVIVVLAIALAFAFLLRALEGVAKLIATLLLLGLVIGGGAWILLDVNNLRNHFYQDEKLFVLDIDGKAAGAFTLGGDSPVDIISDLSQIKASYPDLEAIKDDYYKVIVLDWALVAKDIDLAGFHATEAEVRAALASNAAKTLFINKAVAQLGQGALGQVKLQADMLYPTHDAFASTVFALLAEKPLANPSLMFGGLKRGTVFIYPETVTFKILKLLPEGFHSLLLPGP